LEPSSSRGLKWLASVYEELNNPDDESSGFFESQIDNYEILFRLYSRFPSQIDSNKLCRLLDKLQGQIVYSLPNPNSEKGGDDSVSMNRDQRDKLEYYNQEVESGVTPNRQKPKPPVKVFTQIVDYKGVLMDIWSQKPLTQEELEIFESIVKPDSEEAEREDTKLPPEETVVDLTGLYKLKF